MSFRTKLADAALLAICRTAVYYSSHLVASRLTPERASSPSSPRGARTRT